MVRVANNGITAVVDGYGRVLVRLDLNSVGVVDTPLPKALDQATIYATLGNRVVLVLLFLTAVLCFLAYRRE